MTDRSATTGPGHPILAFVNTVADDGKTRNRDTFATGGELLAQLRSGGLDIPTVVQPPGQGQLRALRYLREATWSVLSAIATGRTPGREERLVIESAMKGAMADADLALGGTRIGWQPGPLGGLHDTLALCLAGFLASADLDRLRECRRCTHLFLDHGRGTGRRWCSMARCGNRAKAASFRERRRPVA
ncbi:CGNR zinc finger domain-containing protein [Roseicyclus sp.]|uniref:CGNR zinc finger domain-containing protein n=1 Tax=Roseicyclus sp. TaxID=1914329 RepID=UPI003FA03363